MCFTGWLATWNLTKPKKNWGKNLQFDIKFKPNWTNQNRVRARMCSSLRRELLWRNRQKTGNVKTCQTGFFCLVFLVLIILQTQTGLLLCTGISASSVFTFKTFLCVCVEYVLNACVCFHKYQHELNIYKIVLQHSWVIFMFVFLAFVCNSWVKQNQISPRGVNKVILLLVLLLILYSQVDI